MTKLSIEQKHVVSRPLTRLSVIACAGSGKTLTAVHRIASMQSLLADPRKRIALLSFSNVAVETFRDEHKKIESKGPRRSPIEIDTLDGFITKHVVRLRIPS
ncbi:UvrD-helicase domain-containing protein [uncultured Mesorhizobium sp.]|uniref:UvrD-helicase domain-containing protein n=1 Tax=uncultured Mesorhizobium sp. TaxID=233795 RepID=UPI00259A4CFF|nr:UvrD-helicase domain-containing protein [uncultured Mesorhizobium sp.]